MGGHAQIFYKFQDFLFFYENKTSKSLQSGGTNAQFFNFWTLNFFGKFVCQFCEYRTLI